jgi:hypothetical protein
MKNYRKIRTRLKTNGGQALLMAIISFLFLSISFITGISGPILRHAKVTDDFLVSRKSYFLSEAGIEDAIYRIKNNKQTSTIEAIYLDGVSATTSISETLGTKTIEALGSGRNLFRKTEAVLKTGVGSSFNYGIQSGAGGFILGNNAVVNGSVYANGSITGSNGASITGSATSANSPPLVSDQSNDSPSSPLSSITFGDSSANQDLAQGFKISSTEALTKISVYIKKVGSPSNLTVRITTDNSGQLWLGRRLTAKLYSTNTRSYLLACSGWDELKY